MRFKDRVLDGLNQAQSINKKLNIQINRNTPKEELFETIEKMHEHLEQLKELIGVEDDEFAQQFKG